MISSEAQRTLVKSPPELWAELSDPASLARHLGALGEVKITRLQPEQSIEWEAEAASGTVELKPSGWGTKVRLTVRRELSTGEAPGARRTDDGGADASGLEADATELVADATEPVAGRRAVPQPQTGQEEVAGESEDAAHPRGTGWRAFFRALKPRRRRIAATTQPAIASGEKLGLATDPERAAGQEGGPAPEEAGQRQEVSGGEQAGRRQEASGREQAGQRQAAGDRREPRDPGAACPPGPSHPDPSAGAIAAEVKALEVEIAQQTTEILAAVLDRLGAAHHRPFSRI